MSEKKEFKPLDVGATERVDWKAVQRLKEFFHIDEDGNITLGGNLEVDGETQLNSGLKITHTFKISENTSLKIYIENSDEATGGYNFIGALHGYGTIIPGTEDYPCYGNYNLIEGTMLYFNAVVLVDVATGIFNSPELWTYDGTTSTLTKKKFVFENQLPNVSNLQPKLYRHVLSLRNDSFQYGGCIVYLSTSNLKVDSLQDLTTLLKPSSNYYYPLSGACTGLDARDSIQLGTKSLYLKSYDKIVYENNIWSFKDAYGNKEDIDTISDTVTTL